jgi:hypothetical protein
LSDISVPGSRRQSIPEAWDTADAILRVGNGTGIDLSDAVRVMKSGVTQIKAFEVGGT